MNKISIKGNEYPCRVTMGAMVRFKRESGKDVSQIKEDEITDLVLFIWCCVVSACSADDVPFDYSFDRFADCLEPNSVKDFYKLMESEKKTEAVKA